MIRLSKCSLDDSELQSVQHAFNAAYLGMGSQVFEFEKEIKTYLQTNKEVICVNSGTAALHLALLCLDLKPDDEILVPTITFAGCFQVISAIGAKPIACDVREDTLSIDLKSAKEKLSNKTKIIMPVHYASHVESYSALYEFAQENNLRVLEDAAHAFGTVHNGTLVGSTGDIVCFSFDGIKNITCGEGGAMITDDERLIERMRDARLLAIEKDYLKRKVGKRSWDFDIKHQGFRYHMSDIMAAIGRVQLGKISQFKSKRLELVENYRQALADIPSLSFLALDYANIMPHIFVVRISDKKRDGLKNFLEQSQIETGIHYKPNHLLTRYKTEYALPNAEKAYKEILTLPLHVELQKHEQEVIISAIKHYLINQ